MASDDSKQTPRQVLLKYTSLVTLTLQNAVLGLSMRYARTRPGDMFLSSTAVFMAELVKLFTCLGLVWHQEGQDINRWVETLKTHIIKQPIDTLKVCVPSLVYVIQNNLLYVAASHLDAATYQVTYQLKILTTALFAVVMLRRKLIIFQWVALVFLLAGVVLVQLAQTDSSSKDSPDQSRTVGFLAAIAACFLSGFAGIYFEKILKGTADVSVWIRNVQLSFLSLPFGLIACFVGDHAQLRQNGFFYGYDAFVIYLVVLQAMGGLLVAVVVRYADNILKGFATSLAIVLSCAASMYLFNFNLTLQFAIGALLVIFSIFLYGYKPAASAMPSKPQGLITRV